MVSGICADDGVVYAAGGSSRGGELLRLSARGVWTREEGLPQLEWVEAIWRGWNAEIGLAPASGPLLFRAASGWRSEPVPVDQTLAVASGTTAFAIGEVQKQSVVLARGELGWRIECAVPGLRLFGIWAAGRPRPARLEDPEVQKRHEAAGDA